MAVFFGADFYNLPLDSDRDLFIQRTNQIFDYMRRHLPDHKFVYQPHPNETDESKHLDLEGFKIGRHVVAEMYLHENADSIDYVFSAQSGASISAFAMGFDSVIFLDLLSGALSADSILGYRSYFSELPDSFFIKSFDDPLPRRKHINVEDERGSLVKVREALDLNKTTWVIASDPYSGFRGAVLVSNLKKENPNLRAKLIIINHRRWDLGRDSEFMKSSFDEIITLPGGRVWYGVGFKKLLATVRVARFIKRLPLQPGDNLISFANALFEENCFLSYHPRVNKIAMINSRMYKFIYDGGYESLPDGGWSGSLGVWFFSYLLEPLLGLYRTIYKEYDDGKVLNLFRYTLPLEDIYDKIFVLKPSV
ncbi:MAG: hypothetical protein U9M92_00980 [Patescibacteria group bacterium]|nr:hypothetical protein [Patescibacteria group bacterium]